MRYLSTTPIDYQATAPWAEAVEVTQARTLYVSGQAPPVIDPTAVPQSVAAYGDLEMQTRGILQHVETLLHSKGYSMADVVKMQCFLVADPAGAVDLAGFGRAYRAFFPDFIAIYLPSCVSAWELLSHPARSSGHITTAS